MSIPVSFRHHKTLKIHRNVTPKIDRIVELSGPDLEEFWTMSEKASHELGPCRKKRLTRSIQHDGLRRFHVGFGVTFRMIKKVPL